MKTLSDFLEVKEGLKFKIEGLDDIFVIQDNKLWSIGCDLMGTVNTPINSIVGKKIDIVKEFILTQKEKEYLENVLKPFKDKKITIYKFDEEVDSECIAIMIETTLVNLPSFQKTKYYKGITSGRPYTLEKLGLFKEEEHNE